MSTDRTPATVVMTGSSAGFGRIAAQRLVDDPSLHVVTCHRTRTLPAAVRLDDDEVDLADLVAVDDWAAQIRARLAAGDLPPLRAIVANAGVQVPVGPRRSAQGLELTFAVNHLAHVLLIDRLADHVPGRGRVIVTSSGSHRGDLLARLLGVPEPRLEDASAMSEPASVGPTRAEGMRRYATSKLANALHVTALADERPDLTVVSFDPGLVPGTNLVRNSPRAVRAAWSRLGGVLRLLPGANSADVAADALGQLVCAASVPPTGSYVEAGRGVTPAAPLARDGDVAQRLLTHSRAIVDGALRPAEVTGRGSPRTDLDGRRG